MLLCLLLLTPLPSLLFLALHVYCSTDNYRCSNEGKVLVEDEDEDEEKAEGACQ